jgi:hypothetical protein
MKDDAYEHMLRLCLVHCDTWASKIAHCRALSFHLAKRHEAEASVEYDDQVKFILVQIDKMQVLLLQYDLVADKLSDNETRGLEDLMNISLEDCSWATKEMQFYIYWLNLAVCMRLAKDWSKYIEVIEVLLGKLKTTFQGCQTHLDRRLKASLDRLARRIAESIVEGAHRDILIALLDANNCNSKIPVLDGFVVWRNVQPLPMN